MHERMLSVCLSKAPEIESHGGLRLPKRLGIQEQGHRTHLSRLNHASTLGGGLSLTK